MKQNALLLGSLLANAALVAGYFVLRPSPPSAVSNTEVVTNSSSRASKASRPFRSSTAVVTNNFEWSSLENEDYREYIAGLRAIGCPEETIRDIIIADVNKLYGGRIAALYPAAGDIKFWVSERQTRAAERERDGKIRELQREKRQLLKDLLGIDVEEELAKWTGRPDEDTVRYGFLSAEKQEALKAVQAKYRELERALFAEGGFNPENRAKLVALRAQREAEMAQLLTPEENEQYQLRNSWTARNMREGLGSFEPTEWEFREIFKLRKAHDDQFGVTREGSDEATREARRLAEQNLDQQLRSVLGEERYAQYQMANDERFRDIYDWTQRANLPRTTAESVYDIRRVAEEQRDQVRRDASLPPEQRDAILEQLLAETKNTLSQTLGQNYTEFERNNRWLRNFSSPEDRGRRERGFRPMGPGIGPGEGRPFGRDRRG